MQNLSCQKKIERNNFRLRYNYIIVDNITPIVGNLLKKLPIILFRA